MKKASWILAVVMVLACVLSACGPAATIAATNTSVGPTNTPAKTNPPLPSTITPLPGKSEDVATISIRAIVDSDIFETEKQLDIWLAELRN